MQATHFLNPGERMSKLTLREANTIVEKALEKAWASVAMGVSSRALLKRAKDNPNFFMSLAATAQGKFLPQTGGVLIKNERSEILGAAGASGGTGEEDEEACVSGIQAAGLTADAAG